MYYNQCFSFEYIIALASYTFVKGFFNLNIDSMIIICEPFANKMSFTQDIGQNILDPMRVKLSK